jgi:RimJ/RimL family protein N-acetyltransferase
MYSSNSIPADKEAVIIRTVVPTDALRLRELRLAALARHPQAFSSDYATSSQDSLQTWDERVERYALEANETLQIADAGAELVGMTGIFRDPRVKVRHAATIWGVYVEPAWRGQHIGDRLVKACLEWAAVHEVIFVRLAVINTNISAIQCYLRCGFSVYGVEPKSLCWEGRYYDELLMGCELEMHK